MFRPLLFSALVGLSMLIPTSSASAQVIVGGYVGGGIVVSRPIVRPVVVSSSYVVSTPVVTTYPVVTSYPVVSSYPVVTSYPVVSPVISTVAVTTPVVRVRPFRRFVIVP